MYMHVYVWAHMGGLRARLRGQFGAPLMIISWDLITTFSSMLALMFLHILWRLHSLIMGMMGLTLGENVYLFCGLNSSVNRKSAIIFNKC